MNDRFKFRIWDTKSNVYINSGSIDIRLGIFSTGNLLDAPRFKLEQCTGLKDKNGKFIYEGDLIKSPNNSNLLEVIWEESSWHTKEYRPNGKNELILDSLVVFYGVEIVGNIHENPELLKESK